MTDQAPVTPGQVRIADYLVERLKAHGVGHVFGVPGDYVLPLFQHLETSGLALVNTCDEQGAGFAADAYARMRGLGVVVVTYGVGGLKVANTSAQAFAEESPVLVVSGAPSLVARTGEAMLHHVVNGYDNQRRIFEQLTVASAALDDSETAGREIDRVIDAAVRESRPAYLEIPQDMILAEVVRPAPHAGRVAASDGPTLAAAVEDALGMMRSARQPCVLLGSQPVRLGLLPAVHRLIETASLPVAVTLLGKSAISEQHPGFIGVFAGAMSRPDVQAYVEASDCLLMLGPLLTDLNLGGNTANLVPERTIHASLNRVRIGYRSYDVRLHDFVTALADANLPQAPEAGRPRPAPGLAPWQARAGAAITVSRLYERLGHFLADDTVVIADPGDSMFGALDIPVHLDHDFLANAFYASLGFAVPAGLGAQLAFPDRRPLVLVGDGAFQMTGMELSTALRFGLNPVVVVLNNRGYLTERLLADGAFNDIRPWNYAGLTDVFGGGRSFVIETEDELDAALEAAATSGELCLLDVRVDPRDASPALRRLAEGLHAMAARPA